MRLRAAPWGHLRVERSRDDGHRLRQAQRAGRSKLTTKRSLIQNRAESAKTTSGVQREVSGNGAPWIRRRSVAEGDHHVAIARMNGKDNSLRTPAARPSRERRDRPVTS